MKQKTKVQMLVYHTAVFVIVCCQTVGADTLRQCNQSFLCSHRTLPSETGANWNNVRLKSSKTK